MFNEQSLQFQEKIMERSGLGDETYLPEGMHVLAVWICFALPCLMDNCQYHKFCQQSVIFTTGLCQQYAFSTTSMYQEFAFCTTRIGYHLSHVLPMCLVHTMSNCK